MVAINMVTINMVTISMVTISMVTISMVTINMVTINMVAINMVTISMVTISMVTINMVTINMVTINMVTINMVAINMAKSKEEVQEIAMALETHTRAITMVTIQTNHTQNPNMEKEAATLQNVTTNTARKEEIAEITMAGTMIPIRIIMSGAVITNPKAKKADPKQATTFTKTAVGIKDHTLNPKPVISMTKNL